MPVKRRLAKARREIDTEDMEDLFYGPGTALLEGYADRRGNCRFEELPSDAQADVLAEMQTDWRRHREAILAAWEARDSHERYLSCQFFGDPAEPWAQREFG